MGETIDKIKKVSASAIQASANLATGKDLLAPKEARAARKAICLQCSRYKSEWCLECGCYLPLKWLLAHEQCPLSEPKWTAITQE